MERKRMAFAGSWYPGTAAECTASIQRFLKDRPQGGVEKPVGGIVPHAGWYYSGSIACRVIAALAAEESVDTILLFGAHMHKQSEPFILTHGFVETPLGDIEVDEQLAAGICSGVSIRPRSPEKFPDDNTFELQYPFLKHFFPDAKIVVCGIAPSFFASIIGSLAVEEANKLDRRIRVVGSTDMTHYGPDFGFTSAGIGKESVAWVRDKNDRMAIDALTAMDESAIISQGLENKNMCCAGAAAAAAAAAKKIGAVKAVELDYATSYEKTASQSFVGYAGVLYAEA